MIAKTAVNVVTVIGWGVLSQKGMGENEEAKAQLDVVQSAKIRYILSHKTLLAKVAQSVEHVTENHGEKETKVCF